MKVFHPPFSPPDLHHYHRVVAHSLDVRSHFDVLLWLQGEMQQYFPHDILIAAWGDFSVGALRYDVISAMSGVRSAASNEHAVTPMLTGLFGRWLDFGKKAFSYNAGESGFFLDDANLQCALGTALQKMRSAMVHGIVDARGSHDCLYVSFSSNVEPTDIHRSAMTLVLPYIDMALRQVEHLPHQLHKTLDPASPTLARLVLEHDLTGRELEILQWVTLGKTNPEIGMILDISEFTVKNHMQRVFKKLDVTNRAQAVGKYQSLTAVHV